MMSQKKIANAALLCIALGLVSCGERGGNNNDSPVVVSSGKEKLHVSDLNVFIMDNPGLEISKTQIANYIERWSEKELIYQAAVTDEFDKHPDIQKKVNELKKDFIVAAYLHEKIDSQISVSNKEMEAYYKEKSSEFIREHDFYNVQLLLVESSAEAYRVRRSLLNGEDFETLAREQSLDASKENGGKLGWVMPNALPDPVATRLASLSINTVSTPIRTSLGYYLVLVLGVRKKGEEQTFEEVKDLIEWRIRAKTREDTYKNLLKQLQEHYRVEINWNYLDSLNLER
ncbi:hypothetical protein EH223_18225 [candidate division KSB1 bacterium]|nr:peptidyl-prolyl cis-trans isomerase [candidate division KSB1 bacterium]RQW00681.1 MAG: hypothetical protein EH223_18225 [candidate division KSB1 bacterium]